MPFSPASFASGTTPTVTDVLCDANGAPVDLTGCSVTFTFQGGNAAVNLTRPALITDAASGSVAYAFQAGETGLGAYLGQWTVTFPDATQAAFPPATDVFQATATDVLMKWPDGTWHKVVRRVGVGGQFVWDVDQTATAIGGWREFTVVSGADVTPLADLYPLIRPLIGDFDPVEPVYEDATLKGVVLGVVKMGKLNILGPGYTITPDNQNITPALPNARTLALAVLYSVKTLLRPNVGGSSYRTRAMSESFGNQRDFLWDLNNEIFDTENPNGACSSFQNFYGWVNATTGLNLYAVMTDFNNTGNLATVTFGRAGLQVTTNI